MKRYVKTAVADKNSYYVEYNCIYETFNSADKLIHRDNGGFEGRSYDTYSPEDALQEFKTEVIEEAERIYKGGDIQVKEINNHTTLILVVTPHENSIIKEWKKFTYSKFIVYEITVDQSNNYKYIPVLEP